MRRIHQSFLLAVLSSIAIACSTPAETVTVPATADSSNKVFGNILVIGVADDYDGRARFERELVTELKALGASATTYYSAVGGNKPIDRNTIEKLVTSDNFDAVLITKVLNREFTSKVLAGSSETRAVRKDGGVVDLFRYEYQELNEPMTLDIKMSVSISSEMFATSDGQKVWAIEAEISPKEMTSQIVDEAVSTISRRLKKDGLIGN